MMKHYITEEGLNEKKKELNYLIHEYRPQVLESLKYAFDLGDLPENAEYDAASDEIEKIDERIHALEDIINHCEIITKNKNLNKVAIGHQVEIEYLDTNEIETYTIVGEKEADPSCNKISCSSPIAKAILNKKINTKVVVKAPSTQYEIRVLSIN